MTIILLWLCIIWLLFGGLKIYRNITLNIYSHGCSNYRNCKLFKAEKFYVCLNYNSLENIHSSMAAWYNHVWLSQLFYQNTLTVIDQSAKTVQIFHPKRFAIQWNDSAINSNQWVSNYCNLPAIAHELYFMVSFLHQSFSNKTRNTIVQSCFKPKFIQQRWNLAFLKSFTCPLTFIHIHALTFITKPLHLPSGLLWYQHHNPFY